MQNREEEAIVPSPVVIRKQEKANGIKMSMGIIRKLVKWAIFGSRFGWRSSFKGSSEIEQIEDEEEYI